MLNLQITDSRVFEREVKSKDGSRTYKFRDQKGWVDLGKAFPVEVRIALKDGFPGYDVGHYHILPSSFFVGEFGDLRVVREIELAPMVTK